MADAWSGWHGFVGWTILKSMVALSFGGWLIWISSNLF
jgi:hypothetical protein